MEGTWYEIKKQYDAMVDKFVPMREIKRKKKLPFMSKATKKLINKRERLFKIYKLTKRDVDYNKYKEVRNEVNSAVRKDKKEDMKKKCDLFKNSKKAFFGYIRSKQKVSTKMLQLKKTDNKDEFTKGEEEAAEELAKFLKSVYVNEDTSNIPVFEPSNMEKTNDRILKLEISEDEVHKLLKSLKEDKSPGPDQVHPKVLRETAEAWSHPLTVLFQRSSAVGVIPKDWKMANITPIFKKGSRSEVNNYRPVSLTSIVCKLMEKLIRNRITTTLEENGMFTAHQHGFSKNRSSLTNILETLEDWTEAIEEGYGIDAVYLDYQKAFDTVPHERLVTKLRWYGIDGALLSWIKDFLTSRQMRVCVNSGSSKWSTVTSGVPQGSVLGPLLFLLYVNDIPSELKCKIKMFADDTKIWKRIRTIEDGLELQKDIDALDTWSENWLLSFNKKKCKVMSIGHNLRTQYSMGANIIKEKIESSDEEIDLGIQIEKNLKWGGQCTKAANKAMAALGMIKRAFGTIDRDMFKVLYGTYVRPHLEYGIQAWSPYYKKDMLELEKVQRRATKMVKGLGKLEYEERLAMLNLYKLGRRRSRGDMIETFKIIKGFENMNSDQFFVRSTTQLRGHNCKLFKKRANKKCRQNFFSQRVVDPWNRLPQSVVDSESVGVFKRRIDKFMDSKEKMDNKSYLAYTSP